MSANEQIMIPASELVHEYVIKSKIEELEKIKTEISKLTRYCTTKRGINIISVSDTDVYRIINKHISELKGETE